jgi:hypothetical protein
MPRSVTDCKPHFLLLALFSSIQPPQIFGAQTGYMLDARTMKIEPMVTQSHNALHARNQLLRAIFVLHGMLYGIKDTD